MSSTDNLYREAEEVLEMVDAFALLREDASENDKQAFMNGYVKFRTED